MNNEQFLHIKNGKGFIAALDQSGGSTPKTLALYGVNENEFSNEEDMFNIVHQMRTRVILSPAFSSEYILGAILFEGTMNKKIKDYYTADYLWKIKGIVPFLKIDKGLMEEKNGVQIMKPIPELENLLSEAKEKNIFGTKMRSFIKEANEQGIKDVVAQQFEAAEKIIAKDLIPIIEPEIDINCKEKAKAEEILKQQLIEHLNNLSTNAKVMLKITIPNKPNFYKELMTNEHVVRIVALSGGYSQEDANKKLSQNYDLIASFSRTLLYGLRADQTDEEFNSILENSIKNIYQASIA